MTATMTPPLGLHVELPDVATDQHHARDHQAAHHIGGQDALTVTGAQVSDLASIIATAIANLVNSAPGTLDTLGEIAAALQADESTAAALATTVAAKLAKASNLSDLANARTALANIGAAQGLVRTAVKSSAYNAVAGDLVPGDTTSAGFTVTLPTAPADGSRVAVLHAIQGGTNVLTVACGGSDVLNKTGGATSSTLPLLAEIKVYEYNASGAIWTVVGMPVTSLDARYRLAVTALVNADVSATAGVDHSKIATGKLFSALSTADTSSGGSGAEAAISGLNSGSITITAKGCRISFGGNLYSSVVSTSILLRLYEDNVLVYTLRRYQIVAGGADFDTRSCVLVRTPSAGSHTYEVRVFGTGGTAAGHAFGFGTEPVYLIVEDL